jgi:hypothetical protein
VTLVLPRYAIVSLAGVLTPGLGVLAAWYETAVLIGQPRVIALMGGFALEAVWVCFAVAAVAAWASITPAVLAIDLLLTAARLPDDALSVDGFLDPVLPDWLALAHRDRCNRTCVGLRGSRQLW